MVDFNWNVPNYQIKVAQSGESKVSTQHTDKTEGNFVDIINKRLGTGDKTSIEDLNNKGIPTTYSETENGFKVKYSYRRTNYTVTHFGNSSKFPTGGTTGSDGVSGGGNKHENGFPARGDNFDDAFGVIPKDWSVGSKGDGSTGGIPQEWWRGGSKKESSSSASSGNNPLVTGNWDDFVEILPAKDFRPVVD